MRYYTENTLRHGNDDPTGRRLAMGLGVFSIGLGLMELLAPRSLTRALGMRGDERLLGLYGLREIVTGVGILLSRDPTPWIWGRVAGDAMDIGTLSAHLNDRNPQRENVALALANVAAVTAADIYCAQKLSGERRVDLKSVPARNYSNRSGFLRSPEEMRGAASDFEIPQDFRAPEAIRPFGAK